MATPSFLFGGSTNETPSSIKQKRDLVRALMGASNAPRNIGEGLNALGDGIVANVLDRRATEAESKGTSAANELFNSIIGSGSSSPSAAMPTTTGVGEQMAATSPSASQGVMPSFANDGTELGSYLSDPARRSTLPAGMRNNNPGNIKFVGQKVPGIVGPSVNTDQGDPQAVFDTPESGMRAMYSLLGKKYGGGKLTPNQIIAGNMGWTPGNYEAAKNVARTMGIGPDDDIGFSDPQKASRFMQALILQEHGKKGQLYSNDLISRAVGGNPVQVASATPQAAIEAAAPASGYVDPMVSAPNSMAAQPGATQAPPLDPPRTIAPPPQVAQVAPPQQRQPQSPQNGAFGGVDPRILQALQNPFINEGQRQALQMVAKQQMEANDPLRQMQMQEQEMKLKAMQNPGPDYDFIPGKDGSIFRTEKRSGTIDSVYGGKPDRYRTLTDAEEQQFGLDPSKAYQIGADDKIQQIGGGGTTVNIDQKAEGAFDKKLAEKQAETFDSMATEGMNARADLGVINELDGLLQGQGGTLSGLAGIAAKYGIGGKDMGDLQAANALINKLIPSQRQPGSGSMSDRDVEMFTRSLPSLWNQPGGNAKIINVMRGLTQYKQQQGEIADQVLTGDMTRQEARRALRALPNPLEEFRNLGQQKKPVVIDGYTVEEAE